jgi:enterochelin esterase family protein
VVTPTEVTFRFPDPDARLSGVRLAQQVRILGDRLHFTRAGRGWQLTLPRPPVWRLEYRLELRHRDGGTEEVCDPGNPLRASGASATSRCWSSTTTGRLAGWTRPCCPAR